MLYFRFNTDNFVAPKEECTVTRYKDGKPISPPHKETITIDLGDVEDFFSKN